MRENFMYGLTRVRRKQDIQSLRLRPTLQRIFMKTILLIALILTSITFAQNYGTWIQTDSLHDPRDQGASVELANGNILVAGGSDSLYIRSAEIFDYLTEKWTLINPMVKGRAYFKLVRLNNGNVLAIGGYGTKSCEIYDTTTNTWSLTDSLNYERSSGNTATLLDDGNVLVAAGFYLSIGIFSGNISSCEIYDVVNSKWVVTDSLKIAREGHTATKLLDGRVLIAGGNLNGKDLQECEIYDHLTNKWTECAPLNIGRSNYSATLLPDGKVFATGGNTLSCELYDPLQNTWTIVDSLLHPYSRQSAIILNNGLLLVTGGDNNNTWELYNPNNFTNIYLGNYPGNQMDPLINILPNGKVLSSGGTKVIQNGIDLTLRPTNLCYLYEPDSINSVKEIKDNTVKDFKLSQNFPNPFNPTTTINYSLPKAGNVKLTVYNAIGNKVATIVNEYKPAGNYSVQFYGSNLASGIYLYRLEAGNYRTAKKFVLIK